jgi:aryl-alcohol dehydrogenase-like predicted oxidoreductase
MTALSETNSHNLHKSLCIGPWTLSVPLAVGTLQWGTTWIDDKIINARGGVLPEDVCRDVVHVFRQAGVTLWDTAEGYGGGTSEKRCGRLLHAPITNGNSTTDNDAVTSGVPPQEQVLFMTKFLPVPWRWRHADFEWAVRQSCHRLQVTCIDIYRLNIGSRPVLVVIDWD